MFPAPASAKQHKLQARLLQAHLKIECQRKAQESFRKAAWVLNHKSLTLTSNFMPKRRTVVEHDELTPDERGISNYVQRMRSIWLYCLHRAKQGT